MVGWSHCFDWKRDQTAVMEKEGGKEGEGERRGWRSSTLPVCEEQCWGAAQKNLFDDSYFFIYFIEQARVGWSLVLVKSVFLWLERTLAIALRECGIRSDLPFFLFFLIFSPLQNLNKVIYIISFPSMRNWSSNIICSIWFEHKNLSFRTHLFFCSSDLYLFLVSQRCSDKKKRKKNRAENDLFFLSSECI